MAQTAARKRLTPNQRRADIIRAADRMLAGRDASSVTFDEIAAAAGVSRALVYNYFGDRGGLLAAVYSAAFAGLDDSVAAALHASMPPRDRLHTVVEHYVDFAQAHAGDWLSLGNLAASQHVAVRAAREHRHARLAGLLGGGDESRLITAALLGLLEGSIVEWVANPAMGRERLVELLDDFTWSGIQGLLDDGVINVAD